MNRADKVEGLVRSLHEVARGLSILFWSLPATLVVIVKTPIKDKFELQTIDLLTVIALTGVILIGANMLAHFNRIERQWVQSLDRVRFFALICFGLSPFVYFHLKLPNIVAFSGAVWLLRFSGILLLIVLNQAIQQLTKMLPDETLRQETDAFGRINKLILSIVLIVLALSLISSICGIPISIIQSVAESQMYFQWIFLFILLFPFAMTLALIWKVKETIITGLIKSVVQENSIKEKQF